MKAKKKQEKMPSFLKNFQNSNKSCVLKILSTSGAIFHWHFYLLEKPSLGN